MVICVVLFFIAATQICDATSGAVIIFERDNFLAGAADVGHVGVAFQLADGTWMAGAVEGPGGAWNVVGTFGENGGWFTLEPLKTESDVVKEFANKVYDRMTIIDVSNPDFGNALTEIKKIPGRGFSVITNDDCLSAVYDVLRAYNVEGLTAPYWLEKPIDYFNDIGGTKSTLADFLRHANHKDVPLSIRDPLISLPTSDTTIGDDHQGSSIPALGNDAKPTPPTNGPGDWSSSAGGFFPCV